MSWRIRLPGLPVGSFIPDCRLCATTATIAAQDSMIVNPHGRRSLSALIESPGTAAFAGL